MGAAKESTPSGGDGGGRGEPGAEGASVQVSMATGPLKGPNWLSMGRAGVRRKRLQRPTA